MDQPTKHYLFLDRDGVINTRLPGDYVRSPKAFELTEGCLEAMRIFHAYFERIVVVTNQQGIGKGLMTEEDLTAVHDFMRSEMEPTGVCLDGIYHCPELKTNPKSCRKPRPAMGLRAQRDFPEIDFKRSIMVGDSISDMAFGRRLGMRTVFIRANPEEIKNSSLLLIDYTFDSLYDFAQSLG